MSRKAATLQREDYTATQAEGDKIALSEKQKVIGVMETTLWRDHHDFSFRV